MLEIKSEWLSVTDHKGEKHDFLNVAMGRNGGFVNTSMAADLLDDPESIIETLKTIMQVLVENLWPELKDPLYFSKKRLKELDEHREQLIRSIQIMEEERKNESNN